MAGTSRAGAETNAVNSAATMRPGVQGTKGWLIIGRGQRNGTPEKLASTGASNARDWESIFKPKIFCPFDFGNETLQCGEIMDRSVQFQGGRLFVVGLNFSTIAASSGGSR
jgi:hypothetical protein